MDRQTSAFFAILESGLWETEIGRPECFPLDAGQWEDVFRLSVRQTVTGITYRGLLHLPEKFLPPVQLLVRWTSEADRIERGNFRMDSALVSLNGFFLENGIRPVLQKGQGVAAMYRYPAARECGDIDLYFTAEEERVRAEELVRKAGCRVRSMPDGSSSYRWKGIEVEHHGRLVDICSPFRKKHVDSFIGKYGFEDMKLHSDAGDTCIMVPSPMLNLLMLNAHVFKHASGWGIGMRQICDMAVACSVLRERIDFDEMRAMERKAGLAGWSAVLYSFMEKYLALEWNSYARTGRASSRAGRLLDTVLEGGNFGFYTRASMKPGGPLWRRKLRTAGAFLRNCGFSMGVAPGEAFWAFVSLVAGQKHNYGKQ